MTYKITIEKTETVETLTEREWKKGAETIKDNTGSDYGYTPQVPEIKNVTRTVLLLHMAELNVSDVVTTILENGDPL